MNEIRIDWTSISGAIAGIAFIWLVIKSYLSLKKHPEPSAWDECGRLRE